MFDKSQMITAEQALAGRSNAIALDGVHAVNASKYLPPYAAHLQLAHFAMGCFWGAERLFWQIDGVVSTAVGYAAGFTPNPSYDEICTGQTGHTEVVRVIFDPTRVSYTTLLKAFFENHDPTQGMRQGADLGTQYRSMILINSEAQQVQAQAALNAYQALLNDAKQQSITTQIDTLGEFYFAEDYHQQYLHKNPNGYCGLGGLGFCLPPQ